MLRERMWMLLLWSVFRDLGPTLLSYCVINFCAALSVRFERRNMDIAAGF